MTDYEYTVTVEGDEELNSSKKELLIECRKHYVGISLRGDPRNAAIVAFYNDGNVKLYTGTARRVGFKAEAL